MPAVQVGTAAAMAGKLAAQVSMPAGQVGTTAAITGTPAAQAGNRGLGPWVAGLSNLHSCRSRVIPEAAYIPRGVHRYPDSFRAQAQKDYHEWAPHQL